MQGKRGVSPLIATVLLIAFSMAIAGIVINFTTGSTSKLIGKTEGMVLETECREDVGIAMIDSCKEGSGNYRILLSNTGSLGIVKVKARCYEELTAGVETITTCNDQLKRGTFGIKSDGTNIKPKLLPFNSQWIKYPYLCYFTVDSRINKVELIPIIKTEDGKETACSNKKAVIENFVASALCNSGFLGDANYKIDGYIPSDESYKKCFQP